MARTMIKTISPSTNEIILETPATTLEEAREVAKASWKAFSSFKSTTLSQRKAVVSRALDIIQQRKMELGRELSEQMGRPIAFSHKEIETTQKRAEYLISIADESVESIPGRPEDGFQRWIEKVPVGPILVVFAWNFPYLILVNALVPALLAGNTVILKPSPQTPLVAQRVAEIFLEAGLSRGVLQVVQSGDMELIKELARMPEIQAVSFTGSTSGGLAIREAVSNRTIPVNLELGGNDPAYVTKDADIKFTAAQLVDGAVFNSGQSCCAIERIYVHSEVHDEFIAAVQHELRSYRIGDPLGSETVVGPVISRHALETISTHVRDALAKGAVNATPPEVLVQKLPEKGNYIHPTLLTCMNHEMVMMQEETFGPVIAVCRVQSDEEAIELMNDSRYGLTASVWTTDIEKGKTIIRQLEAGTVFVNRCDYPNPDLAWTGWKDSGIGCTLGPKGYDFFTKLKSYHVKKQCT